MAVEDLRGMKAAIGPERRLLGLDVGSKTIGLALSDLGLRVATPYRTLSRDKFEKVAEELRRIVAGEGVGGLIIGLPVEMDGGEGRRCQSTRRFAANLLDRIDIAIAFWDERLSTAAVERMLIKEADMTRKRRAQVIDKAAAAYILQGALDAMGRLKAPDAMDNS
ncbi:MAG: Holliday junction resolvase RuvX [Rhodospirillales bacterium]|jgi:putative Holliday junction resolvase|nr:Holliday junction resolvase RuvX [Rhodospirillales bacterium]HIJ42367.1 Holliday junction resolvase RuvX [Rhodospirillaceae bacterium]MDP7099178.1 Holliday junction resolvase RuvX [Rhodospirillales bacterium]MDP7216277.1 Holliday junction resolvase RuvX [Rhodospirillales bacterium]HIJ45012.1 Holliday junction resolvase RuvX [Rhodospirillaceae bacterium]